MRKIILAAIAALLVASCTQAQLDADMQKAKDVLAAVKRGAIVTAAALRQGIDAACANQQLVYDGATAARAAFMTQVGPNTMQNVGNLNRAVVAYNNACAAAADPNAPNTKALLATAISAYNSVKAAQVATGATP